MLTNETLTNQTETSAAETTADKPRLLSMRQAAAYRGCSFWTARDYVIQGLIPSVDMPPLAPGRAAAGGRRFGGCSSTAGTSTPSSPPDAGGRPGRFTEPKAGAAPAAALP